ncbi:MAG: ACP phosphodiesterase [Bryobacterales bacterium]|nr:ACP phosphodiesterase [Bryobacterales bacterium]
MVGQILADFVTASEISSFPPGIQAGIRRHQRIDAFTDSHPVFSRARRRLRPPHRRFAGVLLDVFFDHFLAVEWHAHGVGGSLSEFAQFCYRVLRQHGGLPAPRYLRAIDAMRRDDWLVNYRNLQGVDRALRGIGRRFPKENPLASGISVLQQDYRAFRSDFRAFFPLLVLEFGRTEAPRRRLGTGDAGLMVTIGRYADRDVKGSPSPLGGRSAAGHRGAAPRGSRRAGGP